MESQGANASGASISLYHQPLKPMIIHQKKRQNFMGESDAADGKQSKELNTTKEINWKIDVRFNQ